MVGTNTPRAGPSSETRDLRSAAQLEMLHSLALRPNRLGDT